MRAGLFTVGLLAVVCVGLYLTRERTLFPLAVRATPWFGARFAGIDLHVRRIEGDLVRTLVLHDVRLSAEGVALEARGLRLEGDLLRAVRGELAALDSVTVTGLAGKIDARTDPARPSFTAPWPPLGSLPGLSLSESALTLAMDAGAVELAGLTVQGPQRGPYSLASEVEFASQSGRAALSLGLQDSGRRATLTGAVDVRGWTTLNVDGALDGTGGALHAAPLTLTCEGTFAGAPLAVQELAPEVRRFEGLGRVRLELAGPLTALQLTGALRLADGVLRAEGLPAVDDLQVALTLDPERLAVERADATIGAAPVRVAGGVTFGDPFALDLCASGEGVLLLRTGDARLRANVDLAVHGASPAPTVSGAVALVGSRLRLEVDLLRALEGALPRRAAQGGPRLEGLALPVLGPTGVALDVALTTAEPVRVQGNVARGALRADLRVTGNAALPVLVGQVFVDPLELALPAATVRFERGAVRFTPDRPNVPQLELIGEARVAGHDVTVELLGTYSAPEVRLSSNPPLSADQLVLLVVSGRPPTEAGQVSAAGEALAVYVAKDLVRGWFDRGSFDDRRSFLSRIEVVTGREVSKSGVLTLEASLLVRERAFGREGGVYTVLERDAYEDYNLGLRFVVRLR